jgi:glycosyltransferase involved in cell wall biosynthesis
MNYIVIIDEPNYLGGIRYIERFFKILENIERASNYKIITINFRLNDSFLSKNNEVIYINKYLYKLDKIIVRIFKLSFFSNFICNKNPNSIFWFSNIFITDRLKKSQNIKVVNWIPDFQFLDFPHYFSFLNKISRYFYLRLQIKFSDIIILQSEIDKNRLIKMHSKYKEKYFLWQFYEPIKISNQNSVTNNIPKKYFIYPHQMWRHKRHDLLLEFFSKNIEYNLVLTGQLIDVRDKAYTEKIKKILKQAPKNIFPLGKVSSNELENLMKNATAILNLSEYEGWSSCVEEAISFNIPLILNTLPINIEQIPEAYYVDIKKNNWEYDLLDIIKNLSKVNYDHSTRYNRSVKQLNAILNHLD